MLLDGLLYLQLQYFGGPCEYGIKLGLWVTLEEMHYVYFVKKRTWFWRYTFPPTDPLNSGYITMQNSSQV